MIISFSFTALAALATAPAHEEAKEKGQTNVDSEKDRECYDDNQNRTVFIIVRITNFRYYRDILFR